MKFVVHLAASCLGFRKKKRYKDKYVLKYNAGTLKLKGARIILSYIKILFCICGPSYFLTYCFYGGRKKFVSQLILNTLTVNKQIN